MSPQPEPATAQVPTSIGLDVSSEAAQIVERMTRELGLWQTRVDAGLFLAALAVANDEEPVPADDREPATDSLGTLEEAHDPDDLDPLAILGVLDENPENWQDTLGEELAGWIEAGARLLAPHLKGADAAEATAQIVELIRSVDE